MFKAYDLVNRDNLWRAMRRIKLSERFIKIIQNLLANRTNRVITELGMTDEYRMLNGIDQGEILLPLLWIIYYNPLFNRIKKEKGIGYTMKHIWRRDLENFSSEKIEIEIFNIAYMNNIT